MMMRKVNVLKLIILENASVVHPYDENPTQNFFISLHLLFSLLAPVYISLLQNQLLSKPHM
jgi:hypothetical protein